MLQNADSSANPWSRDDNSLCSLRKALVIGEQTGHVKRSDYDEESLELESEGQLAQLPSAKLINVLKHIRKLNSECCKVKLELQCRMQDRETKDITQLENLEKRVAMLKRMNGHLESVIDSKEQLIKRLKQPFQGEYLKLEAQYHRYPCEVFPMVTSLLGDITTNIENIMWAKDLSLKDRRLDGLISELSSTIDAMTLSFQAYLQIRQSMSHLHTVQSNGALHSTHITA